MYGLSQLVRVTCGTVYPAYASWKALKANNGPEIERWIMFWSVLGCVSLAEQTVEWTINWLPFYSQAKTLAMLWLTLPSIQGTTYVYLTYLGPFLETHEKEIDATIADSKAKARAAGLGYLRSAYAAFRDAFANAVGAAVAAEQAQPAPPAVPTQAPPTLLDPVAGPASQAWSFAGGLVRQYGPAALAAGSAVLHPMQGRGPAVASASEPSSRPGVLRQRGSGTSSLAPESDDDPSAGQSPSKRRSARFSEAPPIPVEHSFVGGQRFEEIPPLSPEEEVEAERRLASGRWFRSPAPKPKRA